MKVSFQARIKRVDLGQEELLEWPHNREVVEAKYGEDARREGYNCVLLLHPTKGGAMSFFRLKGEPSHRIPITRVDAIATPGTKRARVRISKA